MHALCEEKAGKQSARQGRFQLQPVGNKDGVVVAEKPDVFIKIIDKYEQSLSLHLCGLEVLSGVLQCVITTAVRYPKHHLSPAVSKKGMMPVRTSIFQL